MIEAIREGNESNTVRIILAAGIGIGLFATGFTFYQLIYSCGIKYIAPFLAGLLFSAFSINLMRTNQWKMKLLIIGSLVSLGVFLISIAFISQIADQSICGQMWCFPSSYDCSLIVDKIPSSYCSQFSLDLIGQIMSRVAQYLKGSSLSSVYYFSEPLAIIVQVLLLLISLIHSITFGISIFFKRKQGY